MRIPTWRCADVGRGGNISAKDRKAVIDLYKQGVPIDKIIIRTERSLSSVYRILNSAGLRQPKKANRVYKKKHTAQTQGQTPDTRKEPKKEPCNGFTSTKTLGHYYVTLAKTGYYVAVDGVCLFGIRGRTKAEAYERLAALKEVLEQNGVKCIDDNPCEVHDDETHSNIQHA